MMRAVLLLALCLAASAATPAATQSFDRPGWVADFAQMKTAITAASPNLEWAAERGLDLPAVERRARDRLAAASDDAAARSALERFVRNFADGHMELSWPAAARPQNVGGGRDTAPARSACAELGYRDEPDGYAVAAGLPGYQPLGPPEGPIRAGTVTVAGRSVGALRIPLFAPSGPHCAAALAALGRAPEAPCDERCADQVSRRADGLFLTEVADRLRGLAGAGAELLLVDVASNGGGNDSAIAIARMVGGADVATPAMAYVRTPSRLRDLEADEAVLRAAAAGTSPDDRALIDRVVAGHGQARAQAASPCDLTPLWRGEKVACTNLVRGPFYAGGLAARDPFSGPREGDWAEMISSTSRFTFRRFQWTKPVLVLVDQNSASSTELFAAMLQDAGRAVIVGAPTFGAGCGWNMPREDVMLRHSGGRLTLPNCARFRRDGRNEIDGVEPDVLVGFRQFDSQAQKARRLTARLPAAIAAAGALDVR